MNVSSKMVDAACIAWLAHELSDEPLGVVMEAVIKAAMQVAPAVEQEPVAWYDKENNDVRSVIPSGEDEQYWQPLYTRPQPKRMPFSGGDVRKIYESVKAETGLNLSLGAFFVAFDAAERAHGIGV